VHRITLAPSGHIIALVVIVASAGINPDSTTFAHSVIGQLKKANGETVWLVTQEQPLTSEIANHIRDSMPKLTVNVNKEAIDDQSVNMVQGILLNNADVIGPNNPPTFFDLEFGWENVPPNQA